MLSVRFVVLPAIAALISGAVSLGATAAHAGSGLPPLTLDEVYVRHGDADGGAPHYPPQALKAGVQGHATVVCTVQAHGTLGDCQIMEETPGGYGFGAKTLEIAQAIRVGGLSKYGGLTHGRQIAVPMRFQLPAS